MKKIIFVASFLVVITLAFFFYNSRTTVIADDKGKCNQTECPKYADCQKQCDKQCDNKGGDCSTQCENKCDNKQMNNCQKINCQQNSGCGQNMSQQNIQAPAIIKINK